MRFSHRTHIGEKGGMRCEDCHAFREDGSFSGVPVLEKCGECHTEALGGSAEEKLLIGTYVSRNREIPWMIYSRQPENVFFPHAQHVKLAGIACEQCHGKHGGTDTLRAYRVNRISGYGPLMKMSECEACHRERGVNAGCLGCHK